MACDAVRCCDGMTVICDLCGKVSIQVSVPFAYRYYHKGSIGTSTSIRCSLKHDRHWLQDAARSGHAARVGVLAVHRRAVCRAAHDALHAKPGRGCEEEGPFGASSSRRTNQRIGALGCEAGCLLGRPLHGLLPALPCLLPAPVGWARMSRGSSSRRRRFTPLSCAQAGSVSRRST